MNKNKNLGFTLAEVLIVIGIIGVVAALTLPNLNHATGDKEKVTKVKKIYSALTEAVDRAQAIYGPVDTWFKDLTDAEKPERFAKRVTEFMKISKDCGYEPGCWSENELLDIYGETFGDSGSSGYSVVLSDKTALTFSLIDRGTQSFDFSGYEIKVDIDGPNKGKNQIGNDRFVFSIEIDNNAAISAGTAINQLIPDMGPIMWTGNYSETESQCGNYATAWVIKNGNLDYLKCYDELNWETKTSCE